MQALKVIASIVERKKREESKYMQRRGWCEDKQRSSDVATSHGTSAAA